MTGTIRNRSTSAGIANARIDVIDGVNLGRSASTDASGVYRLQPLNGGAMRVRVTATNYTSQEIDVPLTGNVNLNFELAPLSVYTYFGYVSDSQGRPVINADVSAGPAHGYTDANGRYEFQSHYDSGPGRVTAPDGYEPRPVLATDNRFPLYAGGQNITIRRITSVTIAPPATLRIAWGRISVGAQISFDSGQVEGPRADRFVVTSSDTSVIRAGSGMGQGQPFIEGLKEGTASVSGNYFGVSSATFQVQVVP
jgi:hypothetical protein